MPGFIYCSWCNGKGCMCCDAEKKNWAKKAAQAAPKWRAPDVRDLRNQALADETRRLESEIGVTIGSQEEFEHWETEAHARIEAAIKDELDEEYNRQFPNGPTPIFTARRDNPKDMELLKQVFGQEGLEQAFGDGGRGMEEILEKCEKARGEQEPPIEYKPVGQKEELS